MAQPSFAPDTVNQHVQVGNELWIGNPGQGWHLRQFSPEELQRQQIQASMGAIQPAVDSLNAGIPEVANRFDTARSQAEATRNPLLERYNNLISDLRASESGRVAETQGVTAREMGRRGIPLSSTFAAEETMRRTAPIQSETNALVRDVGLDRENKVRELDDLIANLTLEQTSAERDIRNTIANLQANAATGALDRALQQYQIEENSRQQALDRLLTERSLEITAASNAKPSTQVVTVNGKQYLMNSTTGEYIRELGPEGTGTGTGGINLNLGNTTTDKKTDASSFLTPEIKYDFSNIRNNFTGFGQSSTLPGVQPFVQNQLKQEAANTAAQTIKSLFPIQTTNFSSNIKY